MTQAQFANRMSHLTEAASHAVIAKVRDLRAAGVDVIDFGQQEEAPRIARDAALAMMNTAGGSFYTHTSGLPRLRETLAAKLAAENGIKADPETDIVVTVGAKEAILATLLALVDTGDEVLIEDPAYIGFEPLVRLAGGVPFPVRLQKSDGFRFPVDDLRGYISPRTTLLLLCNPQNPSGRCHTTEDLTAIGNIVRDAGIRVLVDEAYEHFVYDGRRHVSLASLPGMYERTITVQTVSKVYNMAGWRVGWVVAPPPIMEKIRTVHVHAVTCPTSFAQAGAEAAIRAGIGEGNKPIAEIAERYERQRGAMVDGLSAIPGVECASPEGTFFVFPDISAFGKPSTEIFEFLLQTAHVSSIPGSVFGAGGEGHLRMVFKSDVGTIREGVARLEAAFAELDRSS